MDDFKYEWSRKGATLSNKTAQEEFGLTWEDIVRAIRAGKLHYQEQSMHGNPWLRLLRREVEALVKDRRGANHLRDLQATTELARISRELKRLKSLIKVLEGRKSKLIAGSGNSDLSATRTRGGGASAMDVARSGSGTGKL